MPIFVINTNLPASKISGDFLKTTSELCSKLLDRPESFMTVHVNADQQLIFGGTNEPGGYGSLQAVGCLSSAKNIELSAALCKHLETKLGIPKDRFYIHFIDLPAADVGYQGTSVEEFFKQRQAK